MRKFLVSMAASFVLLGCLSIQATTPGFAQEGQMKAAAKEARIQGLVIRNNDKSMTLTVRTSKEKVEKIVHFDSSTRWTQRTKEGIKDIEPSEVKEGDRVICLGNYNEKKEYVATRISKRLPGAGAFKEK
jgi:esterase/lipase superfamily enzyme